MSDLLDVINNLNERIDSLEGRTPPEPRWAIVASISPLRVRIETENDPLPITPINGAGELEIGSRVLTQRYGKHLYVWGPHRPTPPDPPKPFGQVRRTESKIFQPSEEWQDLTSYSSTDPGTMLGGIIYAGGVFTAPSAGLYRITASCRWGAIAGGVRGLGLKINGQLSPHIDMRAPLDDSGKNYRTTNILPTHIIKMAAGDTVSLAVLQNSTLSVGLFNALFTVAYERS